MQSDDADPPQAPQSAALAPRAATPRRAAEQGDELASP